MTQRLVITQGLGTPVLEYDAMHRGADKTLARPEWKNNRKDTIFRPTRRSLLPRRPGWTDNLDAEVIAAAESWLGGQPSELFLSGLQKLEFYHCSLFPSWSGEFWRQFPQKCQ